MKLSWFRSQFTLKFCLSILLVLVVSVGIPKERANSVLAQTSLDTYNRGETLKLRREIQRLETEIRRLNRANIRSDSLTPTPISTPNNPSIEDSQSLRSNDPMFDRLATLLIELKEDVRNLDKRMTAIEEQVNVP